MCGVCVSCVECAQISRSARALGTGQAGSQLRPAWCPQAYASAAAPAPGLPQGSGINSSSAATASAPAAPAPGILTAAGGAVGSSAARGSGGGHEVFHDCSRRIQLFVVCATPVWRIVHGDQRVRAPSAPRPTTLISSLTHFVAGWCVAGSVGATLWFSPGGGVMLEGCSDVHIRGLTIDYTPTLAQGVVLRANPDSVTPSFTARFDPHFLLPPCPNASTQPCKVALWDASTRLMVRNATAPAAINIYTPRVEFLAETGSFRVYVSGHGAHGLDLVKAGQLVTVFHGSNPHAYTSLNCSRITLDGVSIHGGTGMGIVDGGGGGGSTYRNVTLTRRPLQRGVGVVALPTPIDRLLATNEDGFHSNGNDRGPLIIDSTVAFTGDDSGNICSGMGVLLGQFGGGPQVTLAHQLSFVDVGRSLIRAQRGDTLFFYHLNTQVFQGAAIVAGTPSVSHNAQAIAAMRAGYAKMQAPPFSAHFVAHTQGCFAKGLPVVVPLAAPLPAAISAFWSLAVLQSVDNSGARVTRSTFSDSYARAFMIKGRNASFDHNVFRRSGGIHIEIGRAHV